MMYPFMTLNDDTEITHSEMKPDGRVKVYIETPDEKDGFHNSDYIVVGNESPVTGVSGVEYVVPGHEEIVMLESVGARG